MAKAARSLEREPDLIDDEADPPNDNQPAEDHVVDPPPDDGAEERAVTERRARAQGWVPQDQYRGDSAKWVDAETFLEKGYGNNDILRERIDRLADRISERDGQIGELNTRIAESGQVLRSLNDRFINADRNAYARGKADAEARMREATAEADVEKYDQAKADLDALTQTPPPTQAAPAAPARPAVPQLDDVTRQWRDENISWFADDTLSSVAIAEHKRLVATNAYYNTAEGQRAGYDAAKKEVMRRYPERFENPRRNAPGAGGARTPSGDRGNGDGRNGNGGGKLRWGDLTADEQKAADMFVRSIPPAKGKDGKMHPFTREEYLEHYAQEAAKERVR